MKDLYNTIQTLRAELSKLNLDCNRIDVGIGNQLLHFTFNWVSTNGPREAKFQIDWQTLDADLFAPNLLEDLLTLFRKHQLDTVG